MREQEPQGGSVQRVLFGWNQPPLCYEVTMLVTVVPLCWPYSVCTSTGGKKTTNNTADSIMRCLWNAKRPELSLCWYIYCKSLSKMFQIYIEEKCFLIHIIFVLSPSLTIPAMQNKQARVKLRPVVQKSCTVYRIFGLSWSRVKYAEREGAAGLGGLHNPGAAKNTTVHACVCYLRRPLSTLLLQLLYTWGHLGWSWDQNLLHNFKHRCFFFCMFS